MRRCRSLRLEGTGGLSEQRVLEGLRGPLQVTHASVSPGASYVGEGRRRQGCLGSLDCEVVRKELHPVGARVSVGAELQRCREASP